MAGLDELLFYAFGLAAIAAFAIIAKRFFNSESGCASCGMKECCQGTSCSCGIEK